MSTANKLTYLNGTKQAIKQAINEDFEVIDNNTTFREYADEISSNNAKYKDLIPQNTVSGTNNVDISNSSGLDKALVTQYGNTYQETTTGKNLLNTSLERQAGYSTTINGITFTINEDDTITANGTVEGTDNARFTFIDRGPILGTNKKITGQLISGTINGQCSFFTYDNTYENARSTQIATDGSVNNTTLGTNVEYTRFRLTVYAGATVNNAKIGLMVINTSETDYTYEPYTNGASPNPDYPQEIVNISGKSTLKDVGKNLFDISKVERNVYYNYGTAGSVPTIATSDKRITLSPTNSIKVKPSTQYTLSFPSAFRYAIAEMENNYISLGDSGWKTNTTYTFTTSATTNYIGFNFSKTDNSTISDNDWNTFINSNIQIEENSTASTYETYKEQSFDIDLPSGIELCKIGTYKDRIYKSTGKNLFDKDNANEVTGYFNTGVSTISSSSQSKIVYIPCNPNTTYTVSKITSSRFFVGYTKTTPALGIEVFGVLGENNKTTPTTITTSNDAKYLVAFIYHSNYDTSITYQQILDSIQIEENSTATTYEGYGKKWYLEKKIGKVVLNGSEVWNRASATDGYRFTCNVVANEIIIPSATSVIGSLLSDKFISISANNTSQSVNGIAIASSGNLVIYYNVLKNESASDFKTWLSTHNVTVYYVLTTPTTTEITESNYPTLYEQLNNIKLYEGVNHLTFTNESGLDVEFDIEYYKDWKLD